MKKRWKVVMAATLAAAMVITAVPVQGQTAQAATKLKKITLSKKICVISKHSRVKLSVKYSPKKVKGTVTWKSSNKKVATVTNIGVVTARKTGKATITAKVKGKKAICKVIVGTPVKSVTAAKKVTLTAGSSKAIKAKVLPKKASVKKLQYKTSNKKIATVSKKGVITAKKQGKAVITIASTDGNNKKAKVNVTVKAKTAANVDVTGISIAEAAHIMNVADTYQVKAVVAPANATNKNVTWSTTNAQAATVDANGLVTAVNKGTADIVATTVSGNKSAKCTVTVASVARVSTDEQIATALKANVEYLYLETTEKKQLTIPQGSYAGTNLIVDMPNGEVINHGTFASVTIKNIAKNTFKEYASGNTLNVEAAASHIVISKDANATVKIAKTASSTQVENNGTIQSLEIASEGDVIVNGSAKDIVPTVVNSNVNLVTNQNMQIDAIIKFFLKICPGAENTTVSVDTAINIPKIVGLGLIPVTVSDTGEVVTVISDNLGVDENAVDVAFHGDVQDEENEVLHDADVYIVPYTADYDIPNIVNDANATHLTTDANGQYSIDTIKTGNYILVVKKDGYMDVTQNIVITSVYGSIYTNELINMLPASWEGKEGGVSGAVTDSKTGDKVEGLTMRIRKGKNNLINDAIKETKTNADGEYLFEDLPVGYYTVQVLDKRTLEDTADRYLSTSFNVLIRPDTITKNQGVGVSTAIHTGQVRFILTWGDEESGAVADADSHLIGPVNATGNHFHTYYSDQAAWNGEEEVADLDLDDTDYEGPETTTIYKEYPGVYSFYVHDYTNCDSNDSSQLAASNVKVEVYSGSFKMATYYMPNKEGTLWHVCDYDSRTKALTNVNEMTYHTEPSNVGLSDEEVKALEIKENIRERLFNIEYIANGMANGADEVDAKVTAWRQQADSYDIEVLNEIQDAVEEYYQQINKMFLYDVSYTVDDNEKNVYENTSSRICINKLDSSVLSDIKITLSDSDSDTVVTEVTPDEGYDKAYKLTASNGFEKVIRVKIKNLTQDEWDASIDDED